MKGTDVAGPWNLGERVRGGYYGVLDPVGILYLWEVTRNLRNGSVTDAPMAAHRAHLSGQSIHRQGYSKIKRGTAWRWPDGSIGGGEEGRALVCDG